MKKKSISVKDARWNRDLDHARQPFMVILLFAVKILRSPDGWSICFEEINGSDDFDAPVVKRLLFG